MSRFYCNVSAKSIKNEPLQTYALYYKIIILSSENIEAHENKLEELCSNFEIEDTKVEEIFANFNKEIIKDCFSIL